MPHMDQTDGAAPGEGGHFDRRTLNQSAKIVETMARDILAARREGIHGLVDLTEWGWTPAQVMRHASSAHALSTKAALGAGGAA